MATNEIVNQYYNLFDETKGYTEILFRAGKVLQSKELNEMQSILKTQITNVGNTILTNGDIIEGCQLVISDDRKTATLTKGRIYLDGNVREVPDTVISISGEGTEVIGAILRSKVVTPDDDGDLNDIATGYDNYAQDGAYRLQEYVEIVLNNADASIMYTLVDGEQLAINTSEDLTQLDKINATLARRTYEESGNYKVDGLTISDKHQNDENYIYLTLESGKAYVRGYEVSKPTAYTVRLDRAVSLRDIENEPKTFRDGTKKYVLNNNYANSVKKLMSIVSVTQNITRGSIVGGIDYLPLSPVVEIVSITQGGTTFVNGTDFQLLNDGVDWSIGSNAPNPGSTYSCTWTYNKTMVKDVDYTLSHSDDYYNGFIEFLNSDLPVDGTTFLINYDFMLCRRDTISLDKDGNVIVTKGQSDILRTVESPTVDQDHMLVLGSVLLKPHSDEVGIINNNTKTITMLDLYNMLERINDLEYNQSITDLDQEAAEGENATELMGVLTDGFIGLTKSDTYHSEWTASIDLDNQELTLPFQTSISQLIPNKDENYKAGTFGRLLTAPYSEITLLSQLLATGITRINSYNAFPKSPTIKLSPEVDNWVDSNTVTVQGGTTTKTVTLRRWWYHKGESWAQAEKALWQSYGFADGGASLGWANGNTSRTYTTTASIISSAIMYMRQRIVSVTLQNLVPNSDNIVCTFNGTQVPLTPTRTGYQGTQVGTLKADASGNAYGQFTVPANTLCGTVEVKAYAVNTPSLNGTANYTSNGSKQTITKKVWTEKITVRTSDPIAQSFQFDMDQFVTGVGLYFCDKDVSEPITVQVRNMVNGYPGTTVYAEKVIQPSAVKYSTNGNNETKVVFDDPVYCNANEQYCFTILSNSDVDSLWIAETTKQDINTKTIVSKNPYLNGTMFSSSNALTWTAHQSQDLKFNLYGAKFETSGQVIFHEINDLDVDRLMVMSDESIPTGCGISWQYSINGDDWMPIETYDDRELSEIGESVKVRCLITANSTTSPAIALDSLILCGFSNENEGIYISKNVNVAAGFNNVKVVVDMNLPTGTNAVVSFATDTNGTNWQPLSNTSTVQKSVNYKTFTFEKTLEEKAYNYRVKIDLTTVNKINRPRVQNLRSIMKTV